MGSSVQPGARASGIFSCAPIFMDIPRSQLFANEIFYILSDTLSTLLENGFSVVIRGFLQSMGLHNTEFSVQL